nr:YetF domain-containing protein [Wohlfahrtiimonas populi]
MDIISIASTLRSQGILSFQEIRFAQIEPNGQLTVIKMHEPLPSVIILVNGEILVSELEKINKSKEWLETELKKQNVNDSQEVFLAEYWNNKVKFVLKSNKA